MAEAGDNASAVYGTQGTASVGNVPGARYSASSWIDANGNLWLFGGGEYDSTGAVGNLNDLWRYSPRSGEWTWVGGEDVPMSWALWHSRHGLGDERSGSALFGSSWIDSSGNLWLFGGEGFDSAGG